MANIQYSTIARNNMLDSLENGAIKLNAVAWQASHTYAVGDLCINDTGKIYFCRTAGASAASGGPTGTTANITDNAAHWDYIGQASIEGAPTLSIYDGTMPANCGTALSGNTLLATGTLPTDFMADASAGAKAKAGTWTIAGQSGAGTGTNATFFRILDAAGTCHIQGSITSTGGGGVMEMDNTSIADTQVITVNSFSLTDNNG